VHNETENMDWLRFTSDLATS